MATNDKGFRVAARNPLYSSRNDYLGPQPLPTVIVQSWLGAVGEVQAARAKEAKTTAIRAIRRRSMGDLEGIKL